MEAGRSRLPGQPGLRETMSLTNEKTKRMCRDRDRERNAHTEIHTERTPPQLFPLMHPSW